MSLSNSGRIVIIDDDQSEIMPLLASLSKMGAPYFYFSGELDDLPTTPLDGIRFVFLDIELEGFGGLDEKSKASALVNILSRIISKQNGPYTILFWTKHHECIPHVIDHCNRVEIPPIHHLSLEKTQCKSNSYQDIASIIERKLKENSALLSLVQWENLVHKSCSEFFYAFSSLVQVDQEWSTNISGILCSMAEADLGKGASDNELKYRAASRLLNQSFNDILHMHTNNDLACPEGFELQEKPLEVIVKAKINSWLFIDCSSQDSVRTGDVMKCKTDDIYVGAVKKFFKLSQDVDVICPINIVITTECDIVGKKTLETDDNNVMHRVLKGFILPNDVKVKEARSTECFGPFLYDGTVVKICLHLGATTLASMMELGERAFRIRRALTHDIQAKTSCYLNRIGNGIIQHR